jgi:hypothetical protein
MYGKTVVFRDVIPFNLLNVPNSGGTWYLHLYDMEIVLEGSFRTFKISLSTYNASHSTRLINHILPQLAFTAGKKMRRTILHYWSTLPDLRSAGVGWSWRTVARQGADHHCGPCNTTKTFLSRKVISSFVNEYVL